MKAAILIADSHQELYSEIKRFTHSIIWGNNLWKDFDIFYFEGSRPSPIQESLGNIIENGRNSKFSLLIRAEELLSTKMFSRNIPIACRRNSTLSVDIPDTLRNLGKKSVSAYGWTLKENYDFVIKTTISSVFNPRLLKKFLERSEASEYIYSGKIINPGPHQFCSGANLILNRKSLEFLSNNFHKWDHSVLDDVAIGKIMKVGKIPFINVDSINLSSTEEVDFLTSFQLQNTLHFRCRTFSKIRNDTTVMLNLMERLQNFI